MDRNEFFIKVVSPTLFTVALFVIWEAACRIFNVPLTILPAPSLIFEALWEFRDPHCEQLLGHPLDDLVRFCVCYGFRAFAWYCHWLA